MARTWLRGLSIAGVQLGIERPEAFAWQWPEAPIAEFACLPRDPEVHVGLRSGAPAASGELGGECYRVGPTRFEVARRGDDWLLALSRSGRRELLALFDREFRVGELELAPECATLRRFPLAAPLDEWIVLNRVVASGGLCLVGRVRLEAGRAHVELGARAEPSPIPAKRRSGLVGASTVLLREQAGRLCAFRTPWASPGWSREHGDAMPIGDIELGEASPQRYRERVDPADAAELLVTHAVVPFCDDVWVERVLRNARRIADQARTLRVARWPAERVAEGWGATPLPQGFAPPRAAV